MKEITTQELLSRIYCAEAGELHEIMTAVTVRFREIWPEWDLLTISSEGRTPKDHIRTLHKSIQLLSAAAEKNNQ